MSSRRRGESWIFIFTCGPRMCSIVGSMNTFFLFRSLWSIGEYSVDSLFVMESASSLRSVSRQLRKGGYFNVANSQYFGSNLQ